MYDPNVGRWLEEDPIGFDAGDYDLYRYVGNNPTNATDPSGLERLGQTDKQRREQQSDSKMLKNTLDAWEREAIEVARKKIEAEAKRREAAGILTVTIPKSKDGSSGFSFRVEDFTVLNVAIKNVGSGTAPAYVSALLRFVNFKKQLEKQLEGKTVYEFHSLPPGYECDLNNKTVLDGKHIIVEIQDQKIYPKPGEDWYVTVTGTIELKVGKGWIAPGKKK